ncbi:MAG TPA: hypothetical protein VE978_20250 [Chitinophagales bacterium]|nr:hypothetical protein [Chitinophagales bacterium]
MITNTSTSEVISLIPISCNEDHVSVIAGVLASRTYSYTLYVDGKMIETKSMVLTKNRFAPSRVSQRLSYLVFLNSVE